MDLQALDTLHDANIADVHAAPKGEKLAKVWVIAKPILKLLANSFFIPAKWRGIIVILLEEIDALQAPQA